MPITDHDRADFLETVARLAEMGNTPIALYGAGQASRALRPSIGTPPRAIIGIIDDNPAMHGRTWAGLPVISVEDALAAKARAVIITCEGNAQTAVWARRGVLRDAGMFVTCVPRRFAGKPWDACLIEQWEVGVAASRGIDLAYAWDYPARDHRAEPRLVEALRKRLPAGGVALEIGSGTGLLAEHLLVHAGRYHCVDFSARLLFEVIEHRFHAHAAKLALHHDETATLAGVPDNAVDLAFSFDVFVHFKQDLVHQCLASIKRVLKPDGCALLHFVDWTAPAIQSWERRLAGWNVGRADPMGYNSPASVGVSCVHLGLSMRTIELPVGPGRWYAEIRRADR